MVRTAGLSMPEARWSGRVEAVPWTTKLIGFIRATATLTARFARLRSLRVNGQWLVLSDFGASGVCVLYVLIGT